MNRRSKTSGIVCPVFMLIFGVMGGALGLRAQNVPTEVLAYPEMIFYNGQVLTADDQFTVAQAVAIRGNTILAVGSDSDVLRLAGPSTQRVDLHARSVLPGLIDTHLHQAWVGQVAKGEGESGFEGIRQGRVSFKTVSGGLDEVKQIVATAKPGDWIYLSGPDNKALILLVTVAQLDSVSPANPLVITTTNNMGVANSLALKEVDWNIGGVEMDSQRKKPTGRIDGFALGVLTYDRMPVPGRVSEESLRAQQEVLKKLNSQGMTTVVGRAQGTSVTVLKELWEQHKLTARVRIAHEFLRQNPHGEDYLKRLGNLSGFGDPMMKIIGATVQPADGTNGAGATLTNIAKRQELPDSPYGTHGQNKYENWGSTLDKSEYHNIILANRYGWNMLAIHSQGDGSSDILLKAYEEANKEAPLRGVWAFDHALFRSPENIAKARQLGVLFSVGPKYLFQRTPTGLVFQYGELVHKMSPVRDMIVAGMKPTMEADVAGKYSAPLWNMQSLITRTDETGKKWGENQKISRQEALWMKTNWASRYSGDEKILGTIVKGKLADLIVLGDDYLKVPEDKIADIPIDLTIVDGKVVYDRAKDGEIKSEIWERGGGGEN